MNNDKDVDLHRIEKLIQIMKENLTKKVHIETKDWKISIEQKDDNQVDVVNSYIPKQEPSHHDSNEIQTKGIHVITAPLVGTFYRSSSPQSDSYIEIGEGVEQGQVLCIVEAMKVMNEIHSDIEGVITKVFATNGEMVEFGQPLFEIKKQDSTDEA